MKSLAPILLMLSPSLALGAADGDSLPPLRTSAEAEVAAKTSGTYYACTQKLVVQRGLVCVSATGPDDLDAEAALSSRLSEANLFSNWRGHGVRVDGSTFQPEDGRQPRRLAEGVSLPKATHTQTCSYIQRPYIYEEQFFDEANGHLCVRLSYQPKHFGYDEFVDTAKVVGSSAAASILFAIILATLDLIG